MMHASDRALLARVAVNAPPRAGDVVALLPRERHERRFVIGVEYAEAKDGRPYLLLLWNEGTPGVTAWFEPRGRVGARDVEVIQRGTWASRVEFWKDRYRW